MDLIWIALIGGVVLGSILSVLFGVYSTASANTYTRNIFGMSSTSLLLDGTVAILAVIIIVLTTVSVMVRDAWYPMSHPGNFILETMLMAFLPASVFLVMVPLRGYRFTVETFLEFGVLFLKFGVLHVLLQFSGFYSDIFPPNFS